MVMNSSRKSHIPAQHYDDSIISVKMLIFLYLTLKSNIQSSRKPFFKFLFSESWLLSTYQRRIKNPDKHLRWGALRKQINGYKPLTIFAKRSILGIWQGSEYASAYICNYVTPAIKILKSVLEAYTDMTSLSKFLTLNNFFFKGAFQIS